jgi:hypothetical protein
MAWPTSQSGSLIQVPSQVDERHREPVLEDGVARRHVAVTNQLARCERTRAFLEPGGHAGRLVAGHCVVIAAQQCAHGAQRRGIDQVFLVPARAPAVDPGQHAAAAIIAPEVPGRPGETGRLQVLEQRRHGRRAGGGRAADRVPGPHGRGDQPAERHLPVTVRHPVSLLTVPLGKIHGLGGGGPARRPSVGDGGTALGLSG